MFERLGEKLHFTTSWHPQADDQSERLNQTIEIALRYFITGIDDIKMWKRVIPDISAALSNSSSRSTGLAPT